jgi:hypothetical protein
MGHAIADTGLEGAPASNPAACDAPEDLVEALIASRRLTGMAGD